MPLCIWDLDVGPNPKDTRFAVKTLQWGNFCLLIHGDTSLANTRPHLNLHWVEVWEPHIHFLVFEAWFTIARSRSLGATNVYHMSLYVVHSQSYQLYQMTYVEWQNPMRKKTRWVCRIDVDIVLPSLPVLWLVPYRRRNSDPWNPGCLAARNETAWKAAWV